MTADEIFESGAEPIAAVPADDMDTGTSDDEGSFSFRSALDPAQQELFSRVFEHLQFHKALISEEAETAAEVWSLAGVQTTAGSRAIPTATVTLVKEGAAVTDAATGDGPVDAVCEAIQRITGVKMRLTDYVLRAITSGKDAQGEVTIETAPHEPVNSYDLAEALHEMYAEDEGELQSISVVSAGRGAEHTLIGCLNFSFYDWNRKVPRLKQAGRGGMGTVLRNKKIKALVAKALHNRPRWQMAIEAP